MERKFSLPKYANFIIFPIELFVSFKLPLFFEKKTHKKNEQKKREQNKRTSY